jgi:hypothetical protein
MEVVALIAEVVIELEISKKSNDGCHVTVLIELI